MPQRIRPYSEGGLSIIEVLVALLLLSLAIPGMIKLSEGSTSVQIASLRMENATSIAQSVLDSVSLIPCSLHATGVSTVRSDSLGGILYESTWWYTPEAKGRGRVDVEVRWSQGAKNHSIRLTGGVR